MQPLLRTQDGPLTGERRMLALRLLSGKERERFDHAWRPERFLAGRMLLLELASGFTGLPLEALAIATSCPDCGGPHGRPLLEGTELSASISHAGDRSVAAVLDGEAIGVDIERRDVSAERLAAIREISGGAGLEHWTRVESVLKADGRGLRVDPREVVVDGDGRRATLDGISYALTDASDGEYVVTVAERDTRDAPQ